MKTAVVGATGMVGRTMMKVLEERNFPVTGLLPAASSKSVGKEIIFRGKPVKVVSVMEAVEAKPEFAIFSAGAHTSKEWAPVFAQNGTVVIDNSSAWRMESRRLRLQRARASGASGQKRRQRRSRVTVPGQAAAR